MAFPIPLRAKLDLELDRHDFVKQIRHGER
jgi:hypothetical protein